MILTQKNALASFPRALASFPFMHFPSAPSVPGGNEDRFLFVLKTGLDVAERYNMKKKKTLAINIGSLGETRKMERLLMSQKSFPRSWIVLDNVMILFTFKVP